MILVNVTVVCYYVQLALTCTCGIIYTPNPASTVMNNKISHNEEWSKISSGMHK